jgi:hypothetical protein
MSAKPLTQKLRDDTAEHLTQARRMATEVRALLGDPEKLLPESSIMLACLDAQAERLSTELVAFDAILTARSQMAQALLAVYREIHGADPPSDYVFPVYIPN